MMSRFCRTSCCRQTGRQLERLKQTIRLRCGVVAFMLGVDLLKGLCAKAGGYFFVHSAP